MSEQALPVDPYRVSAEELLQELGADRQRGLGSEEAAVRLEEHGANALAGRKPVPGWRKFLGQFTDVLVLLLIVAGLISGGLWLYEGGSPWPYEATAIFAVVLLNAVMGYAQQARAEHALAALRQMTALQATVIRDGARRSVDAAELVPGDVILVEEGDSIPADARLLAAAGLRVTESALTGESAPVTKDTGVIAGEAAIGDRINMIFSGTAVAQGRGLALVTATGMDTQMGRIAGLLETAPDARTPLQQELDRVGRLLAAIVVAIAIVMIGVILIVQDVHGAAALFDVFILGVALAVAAVPEGLPAVVTAVLALGVQRMAKRKAVVRHLSAVETLGSADVIASDKTGTLTRNEMTVRRVVTASGGAVFSGTGYAPEGSVSRDGGGAIDGPFRVEFLRTLAAASRASNAVLQQPNGRWSIQGDPTEGALIVAAHKAGAEVEELAARFSRIAEVPFSSERKLMTTVHADAHEPERLLAFTKGAPDVLITRCTSELAGEDTRPLTAERRAAIQATVETLAGEALRTIAVAFRVVPKEGLDDDEPWDEDIEQDLVFLGLAGMIDPPRDEAREAVARAKGAGIRPIMITGDHPRTASVIARELGIADEDSVLSGVELGAMSDADLAAAAARVSVYARVNPEHKLRIVRALRQQGATVAMTGDGVNDAPALKTADIGIAMGVTGTDVAKRASDMVLMDDNFATIVAAVEEGRGIFANIRKFLWYLLSSNIGEVLTMFFGVLLAGTVGLAGEGASGLALPLLATQILWINLVSDGAPALALGVEPGDPDVMTAPPRPRKEGVITRGMWAGIISVGVVMAIGTLLVIDASLPGGLLPGAGTVAYAQTMAFTTITLFSLFNLLNARSPGHSAFAGLFRNRWLWAAIGLSLVLQAGVIYLPFLQDAFSTVSLSAGDWLFSAAVASSVLWLAELAKWARRRAAGRRQE